MSYIIDLKQLITVRWNNANKHYYVGAGYKFTKIKDEFQVLAADLPQYSSANICAVCDFCGEMYFPSYKNYNSAKGKDCCKSCFHLKARETMTDKYGVDHHTKTPEFKEKFIQTCMDRYGVENPSQISSVQEKKKQTNMERFGAEWFVESEAFKEICEETYGVPNPMQSVEIQEKAANTLCENGSTPVSKEEKRLLKILVDLYGEERCFPCYPEKRFVMDCLLVLDDCKIDVEYDGWYWHKTRLQYDRGRDEVLKKLGYKILRVRSNGKMPTRKQIKESVETLHTTERTFSELRIGIDI